MYKRAVNQVFLVFNSTHRQKDLKMKSYLFKRRDFGLHVNHGFLFGRQVVQRLKDVGLGLLQGLDDPLVVENVLFCVDDGQNLDRQNGLA